MGKCKVLSKEECDERYRKLGERKVYLRSWEKEWLIDELVRNESMVEWLLEQKEEWLKERRERGGK
jgi:hypothetical protein